MQIHHRLSALLFFLARHRHSAAELAAVMGTSIRTVYRDIERLREDGYAIEGVPGPGGGFSLAEGCAPTPPCRGEAGIAMSGPSGWCVGPKAGAWSLSPPRTPSGPTGSNPESTTGAASVP